MSATYKATPMKPINPMGVGMKGGEYQQDSLQLSYGASTKPSEASAKGSLVDGPYGGKKPVS